MLKRPRTLKVYVWRQDYRRDYYSGLAVVIAYSKKEAEQQLEKICSRKSILHDDAWGKCEMHYLRPMVFEVGGGG